LIDRKTIATSDTAEGDAKRIKRTWREKWL
jgi:hypothetical protein